MTDQKDRFTTELVRQSRADYTSKHHADGEYCLCEVLEIGTIADQVPLQTGHHYSNEAEECFTAK